MLTKSTEASRTGIASARAWMQGMPRLRRVSANMPLLGSRPMTPPPGPTTARASRATSPVPTATSSTCAPGCSPALRSAWSRCLLPDPSENTLLMRS